MNSISSIDQKEDNLISSVMYCNISLQNLGSMKVQALLQVGKDLAIEIHYASWLSGSLAFPRPLAFPVSCAVITISLL